MSGMLMTELTYTVSFFFFKNASLIIPAHFFHINNGVFIFIEVEKISIH